MTSRPTGTVLDVGEEVGGWGAVSPSPSCWTRKEAQQFFSRVSLALGYSFLYLQHASKLPTAYDKETRLPPNHIPKININMNPDDDPNLKATSRTPAPTQRVTRMLTSTNDDADAHSVVETETTLTPITTSGVETGSRCPRGVPGGEIFGTS
jgi:hypothetical protein